MRCSHSALCSLKVTNERGRGWGRNLKVHLDIKHALHLRHCWENLLLEKTLKKTLRKPMCDDRTPQGMCYPYKKRESWKRYQIKMKSEEFKFRQNILPIWLYQRPLSPRADRIFLLLEIPFYGHTIIFFSVKFVLKLLYQSKFVCSEVISRAEVPLVTKA